MNRIRAIIFDAGGVVIDHRGLMDEIAAIFRPKDRGAFLERLNHLVGPLCTGEMSEDEYWRRVAESEDADPGKIPRNLWEKDYEKNTRIDGSVVALIRKLRKRYRVILISNTIAPHVAINRRRRLYDNFDDAVNSNEVRLSKDGPEIFELALKRNRLSAAECVFVDDVRKFVDIAESVGMKGILFRNLGQLKRELASLGVSLD